jgi:hypothetical protein
VSWIVFIIYLLFFCWLITIIPFFKRAGLSGKVICTLFLVKVLAGIAYFRFYSLPGNKPVSDTWKFYNRSLPETDKLLHEPGNFIKDIFTSGYSSTGGLFSDKHSYWNDVKDTLMVKLMAIANVFSFRDYYTNIIFFNFLFFFGLIAFYRLLKEIYPANKWLLIFSVFLLPSFLFWCSGIHKDGLIFSAAGILFYSFHHWLNREVRWKNAFLIFLCLLVIFFLRNYLVFVLIPYLFLGWLVQVFPKRRILIIISAFMLGTCFVFGGKYISPSLDIPAFIADKQSQFRNLNGGSSITSKPLGPGLAGFIAALPTAADIGFLRPHINEKGLSSKLASVEIIFFWLLFIFALLRSRHSFVQPPVILVCWLFAFTALFIIGYTVNFSGAVVRYRSLLMPLILAPAIGALVTSTNINKKYI